MSILSTDAALALINDPPQPSTWLFADGGVISGNPSDAGGTAAWALHYIGPFGVIHYRWGAYLIAPMHGPVSNNYTEMEAVLLGLDFLSRDTVRRVDFIVSDSLTTLRRIFETVPWSSSTDQRATDSQRTRLQLCRDLSLITRQTRGILLSGHPSPAQLAAGVGKNGYPVHPANAWCDTACTAIARVVALVAQDLGVTRAEAALRLVTGAERRGQEVEPALNGRSALAYWGKIAIDALCAVQKSPSPVPSRKLRPSHKDEGPLADIVRQIVREELGAQWPSAFEERLRALMREVIEEEAKIALSRPEW